MTPKPTIAERVRERLCPNCGGKPERKSTMGPPPLFCSKQCKRDLNNRQLVEGRALVAFVKAWRIDRGVGEIAKRSLAQACEIADQFNAQDKALQRPRADYYAATMLAEGTRYIDRMKRPTKTEEEE